MAEPDLLELLLREGRARVRGRDNLHLQDLSDAQAAKAAAQAARMLARFAWRPRANVALITLHCCDGCGSETKMFSGFAIEMHRSADNVQRFVASPVFDPGIKFQTTHLMVTHSPACASCLPALGFSL